MDSTVLGLTVMVVVVAVGLGIAFLIETARRGDKSSGNKNTWTSGGSGSANSGG
jgi:hypothetical protein